MSITSANVSGSRAGISLFHFLGCVIAAICGAILGAQYLGINLQDAAYTALDKGELLERIPPEWRPATPEHVLAAQVSPEVRAEQLRRELSELRIEAATLKKAITGDTQDLAEVSTEPDFEDRRTQTVSYWNHVRQIISDVASVHDVVEPAVGGQLAARMLELRRRACDYGQRAIDELPIEGVDPQAVETARRVAVWFHHGVGLYERAAGLVGGSTTDDTALYRQEEWTRAESQHQKEAEYLRMKQQLAVGALSARYGVELPSWGV